MIRRLEAQRDDAQMELNQVWRYDAMIVGVNQWNVCGGMCSFPAFSTLFLYNMCTCVNSDPSSEMCILPPPSIISLLFDTLH